MLHVRENHPKEHKDQNVMWAKLCGEKAGQVTYVVMDHASIVAYVVMDHTSIVLSCSKAIIIMTNYYYTEPI